MATPRGLLSVPLFAGSAEVSIVGSVPTFGVSALIRVHSGSVVWTDQPTQLASALTGSSGILMTPADVPLRFGGVPAGLRFRDLGANAVVVISFYESGAIGL